MEKNQSEKGGLKQRAYRFALQSIVFVDTLDKRDFVVVVIVKQLLRCATSIGANIIEAQAGSSRKDFANFFSYALKSANETKFWLGLLRDSGKASRESVMPLLQEVHELANMLASSIITLKAKK